MPSNNALVNLDLMLPSWKEKLLPRDSAQSFASVWEDQDSLNKAAHLIPGNHMKSGLNSTFPKGFGHWHIADWTVESVSMATHGVSSLRLHDFSSLMSSNCVDASRTDEPGSLAINR
ncbi:hypothetical protein H0E87_011210 [Populus deltoides]|uniref:Uncharacterized protein n=1 Tax=Populus deltoides TaxID=3696 RepID=A0A8T2YW41_POPDE|nr:hypothetical protein H0E87_011210 [Populus deltoides]